MKKLVIIGAVAMLALSGCTAAAKTQTGEIDYSKQSSWDFVSGKTQSPIDIVTSKVTKMHEADDIELEYEDTLLKVVNNGHAIEGEMEGKAIINGREFNLAQFHFHAESEHTIDGKHALLEIHFVHKAEDGRLAVIAVMVEEGTENKAFEEVLQAVDQNKEVKDFDVNELLPEGKGYYHYLGSLTTPPLTENVEWYVLKDSIQVSKAQLEEFHTYYTQNNRDVQPLNDRVILESID